MCLLLPSIAHIFTELHKRVPFSKFATVKTLIEWTFRCFGDKEISCVEEPLSEKAD